MAGRCNTCRGTGNFCGASISLLTGQGLGLGDNCPGCNHRVNQHDEPAPQVAQVDEDVVMKGCEKALQKLQEQAETYNMRFSECSDGKLRAVLLKFGALTERLKPVLDVAKPESPLKLFKWADDDTEHSRKEDYLKHISDTFGLRLVTEHGSLDTAIAIEDVSGLKKPPLFSLNFGFEAGKNPRGTSDVLMAPEDMLCGDMRLNMSIGAIEMKTKKAINGPSYSRWENEAVLQCLALHLYSSHAQEIAPIVVLTDLESRLDVVSIGRRSGKNKILIERFANVKFGLGAVKEMIDLRKMEVERLRSKKPEEIAEVKFESDDFVGGRKGSWVGVETDAVMQESQDKIEDLEGLPHAVKKELMNNFYSEMIHSFVGWRGVEERKSQAPEGMYQ